MKLLICLCLLFTIGLSQQKSFEKKGDKERIYYTSKDSLWNAAIKSVKENYSVDFLDEKNGIIGFEADSTMKRVALKVSVNITEIEPDKTRIKINTVKKGTQLVGGSGKDVAEKLFKEIDKILNVGNTK